MSTALFHRYGELRRATARRYGDSSQAYAFVLYEELVAVRSVLATDRDDLALRGRVGELRGEISELYRRSRPELPPASHRRLVERTPPLIAFDRATFEKLYAAGAGQVAAQTVVVNDAVSIMRHLTPGRAYLYVLDEEYRLRVWTRPFDLADLVLGRTRVTVGDGPAAHPMLVPERLLARAAGELVVIGRDRAGMIVANLKSGHFLPPPSSAALLRTHFREVLGLADDDVDVFALFGGPEDVEGEVR